MISVICLITGLWDIRQYKITKCILTEILSLAKNDIDRDISLGENDIDRDISLAENDIDREGQQQF